MVLLEASTCTTFPRSRQFESKNNQHPPCFSHGVRGFCHSNEPSFHPCFIGWNTKACQMPSRIMTTSAKVESQHQVQKVFRPLGARMSATRGNRSDNGALLGCETRQRSWLFVHNNGSHPLPKKVILEKKLRIVCLSSPYQLNAHPTKLRVYEINLIKILS